MNASSSLASEPRPWAARSPGSPVAGRRQNPGHAPKAPIRLGSNLPFCWHGFTPRTSCPDLPDACHVAQPVQLSGLSEVRASRLAAIGLAVMGGLLAAILMAVAVLGRLG